MATVSDVMAQTSFTSVLTEVQSHGTPVADSMKSIAEDAAQEIIDATGDLSGVFLDEINDINGITLPSLWAGADEAGPDEPSVDLSFLESAIDYLTWLEGQTISAATFPEYGTLITGEPAAPTLDLDDITGRMEYAMVAPPTVITPEWDAAQDEEVSAALASIGAEPIDLTWSYTEPDYTSDLIGEAGSNVLYDLVKREIESGDYGIDPNTEELLFERMKEREYRQSMGAADEAMALYAAGGFTYPPGAMLAALGRIHSEMRDKIASANREIAIKRSEIYLEARKVAVANGIQIEQMSQNFHNAAAERLLKQATEEIQATIAIASHNLERIKLYIQRYQAFAQAFEARVKASGAVVELYKSQVEAETAKAAYNKSLVDEFVAKNQAVVATYEASVRGWSAMIDGRIRYHAVLADFYKSKASEIEWRAKAMQGAYDLAEKDVQSKVSFRIQKYNAQIAASKDQLERMTALLNAKLEQIKTKVQAQVSLAAAAMSALNVNLGLNASGSANVGGSETVSESYDKTADVERRSRSVSTNTNENTNYEPDAIDTFYNHNISSAE